MKELVTNHFIWMAAAGISFLLAAIYQSRKAKKMLRERGELRAKD